MKREVYFEIPEKVLEHLELEGYKSIRYKVIAVTCNMLFVDIYDGEYGTLLRSLMVGAV